MVPPAYYMVLDFGKAGRETVIDWERCSKSDILHSILHGDYHGRLIEVHCIDREDGLWSDVSEDMANEICSALEVYPQGDLLEFLEHQLGCEHMAQFMEDA